MGDILFLIASMNSFVFFTLAFVASASARSLQHDDRIIGGDLATSTAQSPWQVSLQMTGAHICGGSLISPTHVMSAGHCKLKVGYEQTMVALEGLNWATLNQHIKIKEWIQHPEFTKRGIINYDYSVITLATAAISGWGLTDAAHRIPPNELHIVDVPIVSDADCAEVFGEEQVTPQTICVGLGGVGACSGDSGGPLWQVVNGVTYLIGNTSWGAATCNADIYPTAYSKNSAVIDWIHASMH